MDVLWVYLHGKRIGTLERVRGALSFRYDADHVNGADMEPLSASLPLQIEPFDHARTLSFFSGLLPDGDVRVKLARFLQAQRLCEELNRDAQTASPIYEKIVAVIEQQREKIKLRS